MVHRRDFLLGAGAATLLPGGATRATSAGHMESTASVAGRRTPIVDVTDLYHPYEDPGDNVDLIHAFAFPEVDLRAIVLDVTDNFRKLVADHPVLWKDPNGPREPGFVPITQLSALFDRYVPTAVGPYTPLTSPEDNLGSVPRFQQAGVELLLRTLRESRDPVEILSFGCCRVIAAAFNRQPALMRRKVARVHVSAGTASAHYELGSSEDHNRIPGGEWNVALDPFAFRRVLTSGLPVALYPCASVDGAFAYGIHNTYWNLANRHFILQMEPRLRNYLMYVFARTCRPDFLRCLDEPSPEGLDTHGRLDEVHHVWETAVWLNVTGRAVVKREEVWQVVPRGEVRSGEQVIRNELVPCRLQVRDDARIAFDTAAARPNAYIFTRDNPLEYQAAMREAWPKLLQQFRSRAAS